jgi:hypothetical protein
MKGLIFFEKSVVEIKVLGRNKFSVSGLMRLPPAQATQTKPPTHAGNLDLPCAPRGASFDNPLIEELNHWADRKVEIKGGHKGGRGQVFPLYIFFLSPMLH